MRVRVNANSLKNAMGTVFLLAATFFVCSTFISMRSVFADPIAPTDNTLQRSGRVSPRSNANKRANVSRTMVSRTPGAVNQSSSKTAVSRGVGTRNVSSRTITPTRSTNTSTRKVTSRSNTQNSASQNRAIRARTTSTPSRVSVAGTPMAGMRASTSNSYTYLSSKLYTGSYSDIVDSSTGLISADAYSNCMDSYYTCMDEICTARSDTKGRCSCAGRATNFLEAETQLESANEELIKLSGQLSLLIATKGKGDDLSAAFSLTDAEKVMNCVSYKENVQTGKISETDWYKDHPTVDANGSKITTGMPGYCSAKSNSFGFDIKNIDGSSSDILAQLKAWADAKDLAKQYTTDDNTALTVSYNNIASVVNNLAYSTSDSDAASIDTLANKWGYKLFEYAHNNVCGRVLDSCFNGIYEACGTPVSVTDSDGKTHNKCANGATSSCPFNFNSYISVVTSGDNAGDVKLNERGSSTASVSSSASCFGYSTTTTNVRGAVTSSSDPYYSLRGPVADARRSIMQKYLLDANAACDVYGNALKQTAQNINYQKIAAEQSLQQKRLEFKKEAEETALADARTAIDNFNECISEIWDCYEEYDEEENWTTARIKAYCSQVSQVPHCYEPMICSPLHTQLTAVIDLPDDTACNMSDDFTENTCRNVVTISEILYGTGKDPVTVSANGNIIQAIRNSKDSSAIRETCLQESLNCDGDEEGFCLRKWEKTKTYQILYYNNGEKLTNITPATYTQAQLPLTISATTECDTGTFAGWCTDSGLTDCDMSQTILKDSKGTKTFYAKCR